MKKAWLWLALILTITSMACYWLPTQVPGGDGDDGDTPINDMTPTIPIIMVTIPPIEGETMRVHHTIDNVDALILESFPPQIHLDVHGWQGDGCDYPVQVTQQRNGNTITVEIFREMPKDLVCTMIAIEYQANIALEGTFDIGQTYTVIVNGFEVEVKL